MPFPLAITFSIRATLALLSLAGACLAAGQSPPPPVITRPLEVWWGGYKGSQQLVGSGATQWDFVRRHMDGYILHGAYWNYATNNFGAPSPDVVGPQLAPLIAEFSKPVIVEHLLAGEYPDIDSAFGSAFAGNVSDPAGFGSAIANLKRLQNYGFPRPEVSTDFIMESWRESVRWHPEWTSKEFFTALTGDWDNYTGTLFNPAPGSADRARYGWFRQWVERLATAFPGIQVTATNSPVYFTWEEGGELRRELGGTLNNFHTWLKIERRGDTLSAFYSGEGTGWAPLGSATVPLGASPVGGLYVASLNPSRLAQARFSNVQLQPFFTTDVGRPGRGGTFAVSGSTYTLTARGNDFIHPGNNSADAHSYAYREFSGDGSFTIRLDSLVGSNPNRTNPANVTPTAGIVLRESTAANSRQVSLLANLVNQLEFRARASTGGGLVHVASSGSPLSDLGVASAPRWLRLTRSGDTVTAAHSADGNSWTTLPASATVAFPSTVLVGLMADSEVRFETATATFSGVSFFAPFATSFSGSDVGSAGTGASSSVSSGTFTLRGAGTGVASTTDSLRLHASALPDHGTLIARLAWFADDASPATTLAAGAQMGLSVRASTAADAPAFALAFTPQLGLRTLTRTAAATSATELAAHGAGEVSIQPLNNQYRPLLRYFTGNDFLAGLHNAFPAAGGFSQNFAGFTTDSPYAGYQKWGGSETQPDALRHRAKIRLYERWLQDRGRIHDFIANTAGGDFGGFDTSTSSGRDAWDLRYKQDSLRSLQLHQLEGGRADKVYFESWYEGPFSLVPETKNGSYTNLVRDALYYVKGIDQTLSLAALTPASATPPAMGAPATYTIRLTNTGTVPALPVLHAHETGGAGWTSAYTVGNVDISPGITSDAGYTVTDAPLYSGQELVDPGASVDLTVTLTPAATFSNREVRLRAFWNPQDPSATERAALTLTAGPPAELLVNGDAESGSTAGWFSNGGGAVTRDTTVFRSGTASIRGGNRAHVYQGPAQNILGRLQPGQSYRLGAWVRIDTGTANVKATLAYTGTGGSTIFTGLQTVPADASGWTPIDVTFRYTEPNGPATALVLYFEGPPAGVALFVDDASLTLVPPVWTQGSAGIHSFTTGANWSTNQAVASSAHVPLAFFTGRTLPAVTLTATQNIGTPFAASSLSLAGAAPTSGTASVTLAGQAIATPALSLDASGANLGYTVSAPLSPPADLLVSGDGTAGFTLAGPISGPVSLFKSGNATLSLAGNNSYSNGTTLAAGALLLGHDSALGSGPLSLAASSSLGAIPATTPLVPNPITLLTNTTLNVPANGGLLTLAGTLADDATRNLVKSGPGTLALAGNNSYRGLTNITDGALRISHPSALGATSGTTTIQGGNATAALELAGSVTLAEPLQFVMHNTAGHTQLRNVSGLNTLSGPLSLNSGGGRWDFASLAGSLTVSGPITNIATGTDTWRTLHLHGPASGTLAGTLSDSATGNSKTNLAVLSGDWTLSGTAKAYTGATTVTGGRLRVDTSLASAVTVQSNATFSGVGSTSANLTVQTGATLAVRVTDWNTLPAAFSAARLFATGATSWTLSLETLGLENFSETARIIPVISTGSGLVDVAPATVAVTTSGFPGAGTFTVSTSNNTLALVYAPNLYDAWTTAIIWPSASSSAPDADPDGDGLPNLLEYALGTDPLTPSTGPSVRLTNMDGVRLAIDFARIADPALTYTVLASSALSDWSPIWTSTGEQNTAGVVTVSDPVALGSAPRRFLRLQVTR
jgi:autotransporter-associated beta strand protein